MRRAWWPLLVFALAGISDWLDGFAARKLKAGSDFGRMLDPIADKVLVAVALMMLVAEGTFARYNPTTGALQPAAAGAGADHPVARNPGLGPARIPGRHPGQRAGHRHRQIQDRGADDGDRRHDPDAAGRRLFARHSRH